MLGQCQELVHVNLSGNDVGPDGAVSLAGVLPQCPALAHLDLGGADRLAAVLVQCAVLAHLNLRTMRSVMPRQRWRSAQRWLTWISAFNRIGDAGAERLAGVLPRCPALAHLDLSGNGIGTAGEGTLRASWRGQASGLVF